MKLKKDHLIEGQIIKKGTEILIKENSSYKVLGQPVSSKQYYSGEPLEAGGTSIPGKPVAQIVKMEQSGYFSKANTIIDFGAGKFSRNADYLREQGYKVFAYDPFNGSSVSGWDKGEVSNKLPSGLIFDIGFTSYVLNVVPKYIESSIISELESITNIAFHITRNKDVFEMAKRALLRGATNVVDFFVNQYGGSLPLPEDEKLLNAIVMDYCLFGVATVKGFQRIPELEDEGYSLVRKTSGFKVYEK